jgi:alkyl hydroperoxide reductase subunit AhpC
MRPSSRTSGLAAWLLVGLALAADGRAGAAEDRTYPTAQGQDLALRAASGGATALVFYSTECPISNYYSPTLNELAARFGPERLKLVGVCVDPDVSAEDWASHAREYDLKFPVVRDPKGRLAAAFGVTRTPEAVVLDDQNAVRYLGRIDDQWAKRLVKTARPQTHELADAVDAVLNGREVAVAEAEAVGCPIPQVEASEGGAVTYTRDVAPILNKNCRECHRKGQIGPFPLETYEQAKKRADDLVYVVEERLMPPWKPRPGFGPAFEHDRSLSPEEVATLAAWVEADAPEGDPADLPPAPTYNDGWTMGTPDLVIEMPEEFQVPATGGDIYRCFVIPTDLPKDMYIAGIDYRPGNPRVVHHILGFVDTSGEARKKDAAEGTDRDGYTCFGGPEIKTDNDLGGWAPGVEASALPEGVGRALPKGSDVVMQVHYHPNGKAESDRSRIGLYFARKPVKQTFHWWVAWDRDFRLDPDDPSTWEVKAQTLPLPLDLELLSVAPHMHLLGKDMTMWAEVPDGEGRPPRRIDLIDIDKWDFQWQNQYYLRQPIDLPKGSVVKLIAHFDNSADNPRNPNSPPRPVTWGEATTDEMCIGFFGIVKKGQDLTKAGEKDDLIPTLEEYYNETLKKMKEEGKTRQSGGE